MKKTLIYQDKNNKQYQIEGAENIFYFHHLGKNRNPEWERVTICVCGDDEDVAPESFIFDGLGCVEQANQKLQELI